MEFNTLKNTLEAALLAAPQPQTLLQLSALFNEEDAVSHDQLAQALAELREACADRGVELLEVASGYRYQVRQDVYPWVARLWTERPSRYSRALLETLALIAYRQPITRGEIEQIRGVVVSTNIVKTLEEREWIRVVGHRDVPGKPALFGTTRGFLDYFNLKSLDELPTLAEIRDFESSEPQLDFNPETGMTAHATLPGVPAEHGDFDTDAPVTGSQGTDADSDESPQDEAGKQDTDAGDTPQSNDLLLPTADEAETPADADDASATQKPQENRA